MEGAENDIRNEMFERPLMRLEEAAFAEFQRELAQRCAALRRAASPQCGDRRGRIRPELLTGPDRS